MKIYVDLDHVDITEYTQVESGEYNTNKINFIFTPEYKDLVKVAIFGCKLDTDEPKFYKIYLSDDSCYLPQEVTATSDVISIGVYAFNVENGELKLRYSPTPTEIEQIMSRIISLEELTSDLNTRVEALENKACDVDSIKTRVDKLEDDVEGISGRLDTVESDIDDLEGDIANTYSKTEVNTLLENKVDTSTYTTGQAAQDEKIAKAELILSQLPKVTGEGTNISLSPTIEYDLEVGYKGDTTQNTLNGYNLLSPTEDFEQTVAGVKYTGSNGVYTIKGTSTGGASTSQREIVNYTIKDGDYIHLKNTGTINSNLAVVFTCSDNSTWSLSPNSLDRVVQLNQHVGKTITKMNFYQNGNTSGVALDITLSPMIIYNVSTSTSYEPYCGGIPSPNPNYPQDILAVTGTQTITVSNSDNTETQTYTLHLGDEELAKIGNYQDKIYFDNGKWYKEQQIGKVLLNGSTTQLITLNDTSTNTLRVFYNYDIIQHSVTNVDNFMCNRFQIKNNWNTDEEGIYNGGASNNTKVYFRINKDRLTSVDLTGIRTWLSSNNVDFRYCYVTPITTEITNTTLLQDLNYIKEHIKSFPDTTNISTSGNLPIIITASALKQLS